MADRMMPTINMSRYKPDEETLNAALWGQKQPPTAEEAEERRKELAKQFEELRNLGQPKKKT